MGGETGSDGKVVTLDAVPALQEGDDAVLDVAACAPDQLHLVEIEGF